MTAKKAMYKCDAKCVSERRIRYRDMAKMGRNLLNLIGLEQITLHLQGPKKVAKFNVAVKELSKVAQDWKPKEKCNWCDGSRVGVSGEQISVSIDTDPAAPELPLPPTTKRSLKKKSDSKSNSNRFVFDKVSKPSTSIATAAAASVTSEKSKSKSSSSLPAQNFNDFGAFLNPYLASTMPNAMFPPWPSSSLHQPQQHSFNNHHNSSSSSSLPFAVDRIYSHLQQQQQSQNHNPTRPQFDAEAMQRYMSEWQNQMLNMNMMSYFLRGGGNGASNFQNILPQLNHTASAAAASMLTAQQQFYQQLHNHQQNQNQIRPFILKDPPRKAAKSKAANLNLKLENNDEMPLDLSAKKGKKGIASVKNINDEDNGGPGSNAASAVMDLNDKSSSPELIETVNRLSKRSYTQQALNDAVTEILSGRLGTRRASVVYGIPRSTLRNKIYKLESIDETNGELRKKRPKKAENPLSSEMKSTPKLLIEKLTPDSASSLFPSSLLQTTTTTTTTIDSPSSLSFGSTSLLSHLPSLNPSSTSTTTTTTMNTFSDLFKQYVDKQLINENHNGNGNNIGSGSKDASISPTTENSSDEMEKRSSASGGARPKRGQYRKYEKGALEKAVLSVRKGEMSVHRAGSFYGVPHSTLEYKVKERNLLRCKRRKAAVAAENDNDKPIFLQKTLSLDNFVVDSSSASSCKSEKSTEMVAVAAPNNSNNNNLLIQ